MPGFIFRFATVRPLTGLTSTGTSTTATTAGITSITATVAGITSVVSTAATAIVRVVTAIMLRVRITLVVRQGIPADIVAKGETKPDESDERRTPHTSSSIERAAWHPRPGVVVVDPTAEVIRCPTPRFVANPRPAVRRTPGPMTVTIRRPIAERVDYAGVRRPDPTIVFAIGPFAISVQIFRAPNVVVIVLSFVAESLREITLAFAYPIVNCIASSGGEQVPIASGVAGDNQLRRASVAQRESGSV